MTVIELSLKRKGLSNNMTLEQNTFNTLRHPYDGRTSVYLIRHGQTAGNAKHLFIGSTDVALDEIGERQASALAERFIDIDLDIILTSPLRRARQTAERIADISDTPMDIDAGFTEIDFGDLEGKSIGWFKTRHAELALIHADPASVGVAWPNGESREEFNSRVLSTFINVLAMYDQQTIAIVCHGGVIGSILAHVQGGQPNDWARFAVQNCSITHLEIDHTQTVLHLINDYTHLDEVQTELFSLSRVVAEPT